MYSHKQTSFLKLVLRTEPKNLKFDRLVFETTQKNYKNGQKIKNLNFKRAITSGAKLFCLFPLMQKVEKISFYFFEGLNFLR